MEDGRRHHAPVEGWLVRHGSEVGLRPGVPCTGHLPRSLPAAAAAGREGAA